MASERFSGVVNLSTTLRYQLYKRNETTGILEAFDAYEVTKVEIYASQTDAEAEVNIIETIASGNITRIDVGCYEFTAAAIATAGNYYDKLHIIPEDGDETFKDIESFVINEAGITPETEQRSGYAFNNPDFISNNNWGAIITPDELRYVYGFGNDLVAPNCATITDDTLKWYIDNAVAAAERDLDFQIRKRIRKYRNIVNKTARDLTAFGTADIDYIWSEPYDFDYQATREFFYIKCRHRPILSVESVIWKDLTGGDVVDMSEWLKINYRKGSLQFYPSASSLASLPLNYGIGNLLMGRFITAGRNHYPDSFFIDYTTGFESVRQFHAQHRELFHIVGMLAAINMLNDYGDGRSPGLASSSISLAGVSESFSTTQSATNALYGARILNYEKQLKKFYKENKNKYSGLLFGVL